MPTDHQRISGLAALVCALTIFCGAFWWADSSRPLVQNPVYQASSPETSNKHEPEKPKKSWWERFTDDPIAVFTAVLTVFTGFLAWTTWKLVGGAEDTAERQLRAYLSITPRSLRFAPDIRGKEDQVRLYVQTDNVGSTPAFGVQSAFRFFIDEYPLPPGFEVPVFIPGRPEEGTVIFPTNNSQMNAPWGRVPDAAEKLRIMSENSRLYIFCVVFYWDAFKEMRHTQILVAVGGPDFVALNTPWNPDAKRIEEATHYTPRFDLPSRHQKAN